MTAPNIVSTSSGVPKHANLIASKRNHQGHTFGVDSCDPGSVAASLNNTPKIGHQFVLLDYDKYFSDHSIRAVFKTTAERVGADILNDKWKTLLENQHFSNSKINI